MKSRDREAKINTETKERRDDDDDAGINLGGLPAFLSFIRAGEAALAGCQWLCRTWRGCGGGCRCCAGLRMARYVHAHHAHLPYIGADCLVCTKCALFIVECIYPSVLPSLLFYLSIYLSIYLSVYPSIYPSIYLSIHPSIFLSMYVCLHVCSCCSLSHLCH